MKVGPAPAWSNAEALARRLPDGVTANAFDPGMVVGTGLGRSLPAPVRFISRYVLPRMTWLLRRALTPHVYSATESGSVLAWLATAPELAGTTGQYFSGRTAIPSSDGSYDTVRAEDLWNDSLSLTWRGFMRREGLDALLVFGEHEDGGPVQVTYDTWFTNDRPGTTVIFPSPGTPSSATSPTWAAP